jgi:GGDEF domain-containing protein
VLAHLVRLAGRLGAPLAIAMVALGIDPASASPPGQPRQPDDPGDGALARAAAALAPLAREGDVLARWEREVLLIGAFGQDGGALAEALRPVLAGLGAAWAGVAEAGPDGGEIAALLLAADEALGRARRAGAGGVARAGR